MHHSGTRSTPHRSRSRRATTWLGGILAAGLIAASFTPAAAATPTAPTPYGNTPVISWSPSHKDIDPGTTWDNDNTFTTTRLLPVADLVFVLDHTKSMDRQVTWVADGLSALIAQLEKEGANDIQIGLVSFDDRVAGRSGENPELAFQEELALGPHSTATVQAKLHQIAADINADKYNWGGQDSPEDSAWAMMKTASTVPWRTGSARNMVVVTDASTKFRDDVFVDGQPVTPTGLMTVLDKFDITPQLQSVRGDTPTGCSPIDDTATAMSIVDFSTTTGIPYSLNKTPEDLAQNIAISAIDPLQTWEITNKVTCRYESDGAPSPDLTVDVTAVPKVVTGGQSVTLSEHAVASATTSRPDDATVCTVEVLINGAPQSQASNQTVRTLIRASGELTLVVTADPVTGTLVAPGSVVAYTVTAENLTNTPLPTASFDDDLSAVLDDAILVPGSVVSSIAEGNPDNGTAVVDGQTLRWTGDLPVNAKATVTFQVKIADDPQGDRVLTNNVTSAAAATNCPVGATASTMCSTTHPVSAVVAPVTPTPDPSTGTTPASTAKGKVAATGSEALLIGAIALIALALGVAVLVIVRRRSQQQ